MSDFKSELTNLQSKLRSLSDQVDRMVDNSSNPAGESHDNSIIDDQLLCKFAGKLREWSHKKASMLGTQNGLFTDPCWLMCLDIYVCDLKQEKVSITAVAHGSEIPMTTAIRYLNALVADGMVEKTVNPDDSRMAFVSLTDEARDKISNLLRQQIDVLSQVFE